MIAEAGGTASGAAWMVAARLAERLLGFASTMVLARILVPADFGLVAMAMVFVAAADLLGAFGLDWALVRQPGLERKHLDTAWTIRVGLGLASAAVLAVLADPAAEYYRDPRIEPMVLFLGCTLLVGAVENPGVIIFRREMNFAKEFQLRTAAKVVGAVVAVSGAFISRSYWALLTGMMASRATATFMSYYLHPHRPWPTLEARRELLRFSIWLWLGNVLTFLRVRVVQLILGRAAGPRDLGLFSVAGELADLASTELAAPINRALFSAYARQGSDPAAVGKAYLQAAPVIWLMTLPMIIGTFLTAPQVVYLVLGPNWEDAVPLLRTLCLAGTAGLMTTGALHVYWAINRAQLETLIELVWVVLLIALVLTLTPAQGVQGAALALLVSAFAVAPVQLYLLRRYAGVSLRGTLAHSWRTVVACVVMFASVSWLFAGYLPASTREAAVQFACMGLAGATVYGSVLFGLWHITGRPLGPESTILDLARERWQRLALARS